MTDLGARLDRHTVDILPASCSSRSLVLDEDVRSPHDDDVYFARAAAAVGRGHEAPRVYSLQQ